MTLPNPLFDLYYQDDAVYNRVVFRDKVLKELKIHKATFFRWVNGETEPSAAEKNALVKCYNKTRPPHFEKKSVDQIFPNQ
jgi:hypothetical protein